MQKGRKRRNPNLYKTKELPPKIRYSHAPPRFGRPVNAFIHWIWAAGVLLEGSWSACCNQPAREAWASVVIMARNASRALRRETQCRSTADTTLETPCWAWKQDERQDLWEARWIWEEPGCLGEGLNYYYEKRKDALYTLKAAISMKKKIICIYSILSSVIFLHCFSITWCHIRNA